MERREEMGTIPLPGIAGEVRREDGTFALGWGLVAAAGALALGGAPALPGAAAVIEIGRTVVLVFGAGAFGLGLVRIGGSLRGRIGTGLAAGLAFSLGAGWPALVAAAAAAPIPAGARAAWIAGSLLGPGMVFVGAAWFGGGRPVRTAAGLGLAFVAWETAAAAGAPILLWSAPGWALPGGPLAGLVPVLGGAFAGAVVVVAGAGLGPWVAVGAVRPVLVRLGIGCIGFAAVAGVSEASLRLGLVGAAVRPLVTVAVLPGDGGTRYRLDGAIARAKGEVRLVGESAMVPRDVGSEGGWRAGTAAVAPGGLVVAGIGRGAQAGTAVWFDRRAWLAPEQAGIGRVFLPKRRRLPFVEGAGAAGSSVLLRSEYGRVAFTNCYAQAFSGAWAGADIAFHTGSLRAFRWARGFIAAADLQAARVRALEAGVVAVRAVADGRSGVIGPDGRLGVAVPVGTSVASVSVRALARTTPYEALLGVVTRVWSLWSGS